jgi:hypothetical protein
MILVLLEHWAQYTEQILQSGNGEFFLMSIVKSNICKIIYFD